MAGPSNAFPVSAAKAALALALVLFASGAKDARVFSLFDPGTEKVVLYEHYGRFSGEGTFDYEYVVDDADGLARASGEGIDPNERVTEDPAYRVFKKEGKLKNSPWKHVGSGNPQADFFAWAAARKEDPGVKLYFTGRALENAGLYTHALKAYRAAMIMYPRACCWNRSVTWTWLIAPAAWNQIVNLTRMHPEIGLRLDGAMVETQEAVGGDPEKNLVAVTPGRFVPFTEEDRKKAYVNVSKLKIVERRGGKVSCAKYSNGQWALLVNGKPYLVKGVTYNPTMVGKNYMWNWTEADENSNGINDVAYESWVDADGGGRRDDDEAAVGDFRLLKDMGCNTIRVFDTIPLNKDLLRDMFRKHGIRVMLCNPLGAYTVYSQARWEVGTDYTDKQQRER
ncbi:MAG: hypothetical protein ABH885_01885, partial [Candidatus Omnitrophota bacterium]